MATEATVAKKYFGTERRTPLASASCFTIQLTSMAQWVAVAMKQVSPQLCPNAQGQCQTHSVSQTVWLVYFSTAIARK